MASGWAGGEAKKPVWDCMTDEKTTARSPERDGKKKQYQQDRNQTTGAFAPVRSACTIFPPNPPPPPAPRSSRAKT